MNFRLFAAVGVLATAVYYMGYEQVVSVAITALIMFSAVVLAVTGLDVGAHTLVQSLEKMRSKLVEEAHSAWERAPTAP